jgi:hypothetical protein
MIEVILAVLVWCAGWWLNSRLANSAAASTRNFWCHSADNMGAFGAGA